MNTRNKHLLLEISMHPQTYSFLKENDSYTPPYCPQLQLFQVLHEKLLTSFHQKDERFELLSVLANNQSFNG